MSTNAAQLKGKLNSFKSEIFASNVGLFTLQETHFTSKGKVVIENFETFEAIRKKDKGGTMIGAHKALKPVLIHEYSDDFELLVVEIEVANRQIRVMSGYGPQESWSESERMPFFLALEEEIIKAQLAGRSILIELDANSKLGPKLVPGDMHEQSMNGKVLAAIIARHGLIIGNSMKKCKGTVTRKRVTKSTIEESIIDFVLMSEDLSHVLETILIDDERKHVLTRITKTKKGIKIIESDHNVIFSRFKLPWNKKLCKQRHELFNLKNEECQKVFKEATTAANNNNYLSEVFDQKEHINYLTEKFMKRLNKTIQKCFRKIRVVEKIDKEKEELFKRWRKLRNNINETNKKEFEKLENELAEKYAKEYIDKIEEKTGGIDGEDGAIKNEDIWKLKKDLFPRNKDPPTAMFDPESGNLLTNEEKIENAAVNVYKERLRNKPMDEDLKHIKESKEALCVKLLRIAKTRKTPPWIWGIWTKC